MITVSRNSTLNKPPFINDAEFKSLSISHQSKPIAISLRKAKSIRKQRTLPHCEIEFFDFGSKFIFEIIEIEGELPSTELGLYLKFDDNVIKITLSGEWNDDEGLYVKNFGFDVGQQGETPNSVFLLKTFWIMLGLSVKLKIKIPVLNQEATMSFDTDLKAISELLQTRQIAYRLMVIEKTYGIRLSVPQFIEGRDIENIAFCYKAIIERKFEWFCDTLTFFPLSTTEYIDLLPPTNSLFLLTFPTQNETRIIFDRSLNLGQLFIEIDQAMVVNYEEARQKLLALNGAPVEVIVKSMNGKMRYKAINVPILPKNAFSREIQQLIDLEEKFDSMFFDKYINSFSNAFEGLTDVQIQAITERPDLEEEAFNF
jgi:hypothetical protein